MGEVNMPSEQAIALFTNVFGYAPDPEALHAGECWQVERIDAALRRAKAEGQQDAIKLMLEVAIVQGQTGNINCKNAIVDAVNVVRGELDARAAQIEEGE